MDKKRSFPLILLTILFIFSLSVFYPRTVWSYPGAIYDHPVKDKVVAITFDDGPMPVYTTQILDILDHYQAKATFFMIGERMKEYPGIVKEVSEHGHVIANHTFTHPANLRTLDDRQVQWELKAASDVSESLTGQRVYLFRPPRGIMDKRLMQTVREAGYEVIMWSICADNKAAPTPELMAKRVSDQIRPGQIILLHDGRVPERKMDVEATRLILADLSEKGYRFVSVPELIDLATMPKPPTVSHKSRWPFRF
ncbi:MAG: polysaccharide deacetylase family protein [Syntrophomonadaceae bacterium]|nr:polysaccharide deacetylase family protein [Syntrophomonadaceae bacterium]